MEEWIVELPASARRPFDVYVNGVRQLEGRDFRVLNGRLAFNRPLVKEGQLSFWRWFLGAWGIGTYRRDDQVDVSWQGADGMPRVAHALDITPPEGQRATAPSSSAR